MGETWKIEVEALTDQPAPEDPEETLRSFAALDKAARSPQYSFRGGAVQHCPLPYLDVHLHDDSGNPLADTPVKLDFTEGGGREGKTDKDGRVHFADVDVDAGKLDVEIVREWPEGAEEPAYRARVHERSALTGPATTEPRDEDEPILYELPFLDPVELRGGPLGEEDDDAEDGAAEPVETSTI